MEYEEFMNIIITACKPADIKYAVIGAGAVGSAVAYELSQRFGDDVYVFERNSKITGENQSSRNSGVIHAGIYYSNSSQPLKAKFCVEGNRLLYDFCRQHSVPHANTGKLLVATNEREAEYLDDVLKAAKENGVPEVRMLSGDEARAFEPNVKASVALYVPSSGIIDPTSLVSRLYTLAKDKGANFVFGAKVVGITPKDNKFVITTEQNCKTEEFEAENLINCAGLYSDEIAKMVNPESPFVMNPVRGEAAKFYKSRPDLKTGMNVYPNPHGFYVDTKEKANVSLEEFKQLLKNKKVQKTVGVHLTPTFDLENNNYVVGTTVTIGPLLKASNKEDYAPIAQEKEFFDRVKGFFPNLKLEDISLHQTGIQARLKDYTDFVIEPDKKHPNCINLIGIDSPGLTSSLAIAKYVSGMIK